MACLCDVFSYSLPFPVRLRPHGQLLTAGQQGTVVGSSGGQLRASNALEQAAFEEADVGRASKDSGKDYRMNWVPAGGAGHPFERRRYMTTEPARTGRVRRAVGSSQTGRQ